MVMNVSGSNGWTFPDGSTQATAGYTGFRNRIINGDMRIDQRNAGASVTPSSTGATYTLDRWFLACSQASKFTVRQNLNSVAPPAGFSNYVGLSVASAVSIASGDYFIFGQTIEGFNIADLGWGTANAQTVTLSFWVRSSLTGTFGGSLKNSAGNRSYPFTYTISSANTWEQKSIIISGDQTGAWLTNNGAGIVVNFGLGMGSTYSGTAGSWAAANYNSATGATSVVGTNGATFYITGCQLEKGSVATPFEFRSIGQELALCQRYTFRPSRTTSGGIPRVAFGSWGSSTNAGVFPQIKVTMRAAPSLTMIANGSMVIEGVAWYAVTSAVITAESSADFPFISANVASSAASAGQCTSLGSGADYILSAEL